MAGASRKSDRRTGRRFRRAGPILTVAVGLMGLVAYTAPARMAGLWDAGLRDKVKAAPSTPLPPDAKTRLGINLFGIATYNRQQVFTNLITQSEWHSSHGQTWTLLPAEQMDGSGWVRYLKPGQTAPRPLILPPAPFRRSLVRCTFTGTGAFTVGGVARLREQGDQWLTLDLETTGAPDEGAWIELVATDPRNPVRNIDCREADRPADERFHPAFLASVKDFRILRFLDWQRTNDNRLARWPDRTLPGSASQAGPEGVSIEDMVDLANRTGTDPWFLMPYRADAAYVRAFARLVHDRLDPARTVYVELGNEIWNDMFDAAQQAQREGVAMHLADGDPGRARMIRYADKAREVMVIWTKAFEDRPARLVRVAASQHANPDLATIILGHADTANWVDALATAPYIWLDLQGYQAKDLDRIFAKLPGAIDFTIDLAERNRAIAARYGKRFIAYEGGQHLVTQDLVLARAVQRDPRMGALYSRYLDRWNERIRSDLTLYASTAPISQYGSWGLQEYGGQPPGEAPKLRAVRQFLERRP